MNKSTVVVLVLLALACFGLLTSIRLSHTTSPGNSQYGTDIALDHKGTNQAANKHGDQPQKHNGNEETSPTQASDSPQKPPPSPATARTAAELLDLLRIAGTYGPAAEKLEELIRTGKCDPTELATLLRPDDHEDVILLVTMALVNIGSEKAMHDLLGIFDALPDNSDIKRNVGEAIVTIKNPAATPLLIRTITSSQNPLHTDIAQRTLANMADRDTILNLINSYLSTPNPTDKQLFADTIRHMRNPDLVPALATIVDGEKTNGSLDLMGEAAADTLAVIGSPAAIDCLVNCLSHITDDSASAPLYNAIARVSNPESLNLIIKSATDLSTGAKLRIAFIRAMKNYEFDQVAPTLHKLAQSDANPDIRYLAQQSLSSSEKNRSR